jgi:protein-S-isoprenylcysteine O-methyltransferase Ste14
MSAVRPYKFTRKFNMLQALLLVVLGMWLCWGQISTFFYGAVFWGTFLQLFKSEEPTNLQLLIWGHKKDKK